MDMLFDCTQSTATSERESAKKSLHTCRQLDPQPAEDGSAVWIAGHLLADE
jgi:hypothetical protein